MKWMIAFLMLSGCEQEPRSLARVIEDRSELVGGIAAVGEVGDFLLENDRIRIVVQGPGHSRGIGIFGGALIDADLRRPSERGDSRGGTGNDTFTELFPASFFQAVAVESVAIASDGSDGGPARVIATGRGGDFLEIVATLNRAVLGSHQNFIDRLSEQRFRYEIIYSLPPGARHVDVTLRVTNVSGAPVVFPSPDAASLLSFIGVTFDRFPIPIGEVVVFSEVSRPFAPDVGFDLRFGIERAYERNTADFPFSPGLITEWVAASGEDVSYGLVAAESDRNYVYSNRDVYEGATDGEITRSSMIMPFVTSSFFLTFHGQAPDTLADGEFFETTKHFIVGDGDVGSILDEVHRIQGKTTGTLSARVLDEETHAPAEGAHALVYRRGPAGRRILSEYRVRAGGRFGGTLEPGDYSVRVGGEPRPLGDFVDFSIRAGEATELTLRARSTGRVVVHLFDDEGTALPGKVTVLGTYGPENAGREARTFLFDLEAGESFRTTDLVVDTDEPSTRRYIEATDYTNRGKVGLDLRPGTYELVLSRGPEYEALTVPVTIEPGRTKTISRALRRVIDTSGYVAADMHLHSINSRDSALDLDHRVRALAGEGVEWAVATDHNFVTDYSQYIARNDLEDWVRSSVGLELTTVESGHFNGYPLRYETGDVTHGAVEWASRPPAELFGELRARGRYGPSDTIVQVNHPRDGLLGYFNQYGRDGFTMEPEPTDLIDMFVSATGPAFVDAAGQSTFSLDFDAIELVNGKLLWQIHHYRVPEERPAGMIPDVIPPPHTVLVDSEGLVEWPGVVDDWYNLLNLGHRYIGVGTSDSHEIDEEPGYFRTMVFTGTDSARELGELDFVRGMQSRRAIATNGPMLEMWIDDRANAIGSTVRSADATVDVGIRVQAPPWMSVGRLNVVRNGVLVTYVDVDDNANLATTPFETTIALPLATDALGAPIDSWFVVEAIGYRSLFPIVRPLELPPIQPTVAFEAFAAPLGLIGSEWGDLAPAEARPVTAYAITNPVWVTTHDGEFVPPGLVPRAMQMAASQDAGLDQNPPTSLTAERISGRLPDAPRAVRLPRARYDVRRLFEVFGHGH
jgi:hypothetical protein